MFVLLYNTLAISRVLYGFIVTTVHQLLCVQSSLMRTRASDATPAAKISMRGIARRAEILDR
jgi:hypothetical protein